jgi:hypothetical protein
MQTSHETIDDLFDFLQNKTIKSVDVDHYDGKNYLVFLLSCGSYAYISCGNNDGSLYLAIEKNVIN